MEAGQRDLLRAQAKFLSDYGSEDALRRFQEKLSDAERELLACEPNLIQWSWRRFVEAVSRMVRVLIEALEKVLRVVSEAFASAAAIIFGRNTGLSGREAL